MSSGGGGGGGGGRVWPPREKNYHALQEQLKKGDVKCDKCDSSATEQPNRLRKFFCDQHQPFKEMHFVTYGVDDLGLDCWEFSTLGWISECDKDILERLGRQDVIQFIQAHEGFHGWTDKCPGCFSSVENCQKECAECVDWSGDEDDDEEDDEEDEDDDEEDGIHGDERLDQWVRDSYGEEFDWVFLDCKKGYEVIEELPKFVVLDDSGDKKTGIAIVKKGDDDDKDVLAIGQLFLGVAVSDKATIDGEAKADE